MLAARRSGEKEVDGELNHWRWMKVIIFKRVLFVNLSQVNFEAGVHSWDGPLSASWPPLAPFRPGGVAQSHPGRLDQVPTPLLALYAPGLSWLAALESQVAALDDLSGYRTS
jgi:hypothetical protein